MDIKVWGGENPARTHIGVVLHHYPSLPVDRKRITFLIRMLKRVIPNCTSETWKPHWCYRKTYKCYCRTETNKQKKQQERKKGFKTATSDK